jgi:hypothetical protein
VSAPMHAIMCPCLRMCVLRPDLYHMYSMSLYFGSATVFDECSDCTSVVWLCAGIGLSWSVLSAASCSRSL